MKSIKDQIEVFETTSRRADFFNMKLGPFVTCITESLPPKNDSFPEILEHVCRVQIGVVFACNQAESDRAAANAKARLVHTLYRDQLELVHDIRSAIFAGDRDEALRLLDRMHETMRA